MKNLFKNAHKLAKVMNEENKKQGFNTSYQADFKLAISIIMNGQLNKVNKLVNIETFEAIAPTKEETTKEETKAENKFPIVSIPVNVLNVFGQTVYNTIESLVSQAVNGFVIGEGEKAKTIKGWNALTGIHLEEKQIAYFDGIEKLETVESFEMLQTIMLTFFMADNVKRMIAKYTSMGTNYKKLDDREEAYKAYIYSYMNAPTTTDAEPYEVDEVFSELISVSLEKVFSEKMFEKAGWAFSSVYFRISNIIRKMKGKATSRLYRELIKNDVETVTEFKSDIYNEMNFLSDEEAEILNLMIAGYKQNEIDDMKGQRMDRKVKAMRKKLESLSGMTIKEAKQAQKDMIKKQKEAKKEMIERKKEELAELPVRELGKVVKRYTVESLASMKVETMEKKLNASNVDMIEKMDRLSKMFNSKAINC